MFGNSTIGNQTESRPKYVEKQHSIQINDQTKSLMKDEYDRKREFAFASAHRSVIRQHIEARKH